MLTVTLLLFFLNPGQGQGSHVLAAGGDEPPAAAAHRRVGHGAAAAVGGAGATDHHHAGRCPNWTPQDGLKRKKKSSNGHRLSLPLWHQT